MSSGKTVVRGVAHIRTHSGRSRSNALPHDIYMRVTTLEIEKARRLKERESAARRVAEIDERLADIEAEKASLLTLLDEKDRPGPRGGRYEGVAEEDPGDAPCFSLRY